MSGIETDPVKIDDHEFRFIPPNEVQFVFRGPFEESHADAYLDFIFKHADEYNGLLYSAYDLTTLTRVTGGGRKRVINVARPYPYAALAVIGADFSIRALSAMTLRAGKLVAPKQFHFPYEFFATMDEAHVWFDELRAKPG